MAVSGVNGASPEQPQRVNQPAEQTEQGKPNSVWAEFNDQDGNVDMNDVKYTSEKQDTFINQFLKMHIGEKWTKELKENIQRQINSFNKFSKGIDSGREALNDPQGWFNSSVAQNEESFGATVLQNEQKLNETVLQNEQEMAEFTEDANGKVANFKADAVKEKTEFVKESVNKILEDLQNGYSGAVLLGSLGTIVYDSEQKAFVMKISDGNSKVLNDDMLAKVINFAIEKELNISGHSKKVTNE